MKAIVREQVLSQLQQPDGFKGFIALGDRQNGKLLGVAFWESEEALRATDEAASRLIPWPFVFLSLFNEVNGCSPRIARKSSYPLAN